MVVAIGGGMLSSGVSLTLCIISDVGDQGTIKGLNIREWNHVGYNTGWG